MRRDDRRGRPCTQDERPRPPDGGAGRAAARQPRGLHHLGRVRGEPARVPRERPHAEARLAQGRARRPGPPDRARPLRAVRPDDARTRQRLVHTLVQGIVVDLDGATNEAVLVVHWAGGRHTEIRVARVKTGRYPVDRTRCPVEAVRRLAPEWPDREGGGGRPQPYAVPDRRRRGLDVGEGAWAAQAPRLAGVRPGPPAWGDGRRPKGRAASASASVRSTG